MAHISEKIGKKYYKKTKKKEYKEEGSDYIKCFLYLFLNGVSNDSYKYSCRNAEESYCCANHIFVGHLGKVWKTSFHQFSLFYTFVQSFQEYLVDGKSRLISSLRSYTSCRRSECLQVF